MEFISKREIIEEIAIFYTTMEYYDKLDILYIEIQEKLLKDHKKTTTIKYIKQVLRTLIF